MPGLRPTIGQLYQMRAESAAFPAELVEIPRHKWAPEQRAAREIKRVLRNNGFLVQVFEDGGTLRLTVQRTEWDAKVDCWRAGITWDELQDLKRQAGYGDRCAVELYPPDDKVVNVANLRHLWLLDEPPPFMWRQGK